MKLQSFARRLVFAVSVPVLFLSEASAARSKSAGFPGLPAPGTGPRCGQDEVQWRVCGPRPGSLSGKPAERCPSSPAKLDDVRTSALYDFDSDPVYEAEAARRGYPGFVFEAETHGDYPREQARGDFRPAAPFPVVECYYLGCTKLQVAAKGVATSGGSESCIGPLIGGTSKPAKGVADCPSAVRIAGAYRPLKRRGENGACCYPVPPPVPP